MKEKEKNPETSNPAIENEDNYEKIIEVSKKFEDQNPWSAMEEFGRE